MLYDVSGNVVYPAQSLHGIVQNYAYSLSGEMIGVNGANKYPKFSILGDSISTYAGYIVDGNSTWYPQDVATNNVQNVEETWWRLFEAEFGSVLDTNNSYSGSPISYDGWVDGTDTGAKEWSFIGRSGHIGEPDLLLVFGGTNDSSIIDSHGGTVGEYMYDGWTDNDLTTYRPALAYLLNKLKTEYPDTQIVFIMGHWMRTDVKESTLTICAHYNVPCVGLAGVSMAGGHPDKAGMVTIKNQLIRFMAENGLV